MSRSPSLLALLVALLPTTPQAAPAPPPCTVIANVRAHTPAGPEDGVTVVLADGVIRAISRDVSGLSAPGDGGILWGQRSCVYVDGAGKQLAPGFIEPFSTLGIVEIGAEEAARDIDAGGASPVRAHIRVVDSVDPLSSTLPVARREGITSAIVVSEGGSFSGTAAAIRLAGRTQADAVLREAVAVRANLAVGASFSGRLAHLRSVLDEAQTYAAKPAAWQVGPGTRADAPPEESLRALGPVLKGELPLLVSANSASDLEALCRFSKERGLRLVVEGAAEGWIVAAQLAEARVAVVVDPYAYGPGSFDQIHAREDNPALLREACVVVMISTRSAHFARVLRQLAGNAVRGGMTHGDALRAITSAPADTFGLPDRGRLRVGGAADVVLWDGDPLELSSSVTMLWIDGEARSLETRQTELLRRYRTLPGSPTAPLALP